MSKDNSTSGSWNRKPRWYYERKRDPDRRIRRLWAGRPDPKDPQEVEDALKMAISYVPDEHEQDRGRFIHYRDLYGRALRCANNSDVWRAQDAMAAMDVDTLHAIQRGDKNISDVLKERVAKYASLLGVPTDFDGIGQDYLWDNKCGINLLVTRAKPRPFDEAAPRSTWRPRISWSWRPPRQAAPVSNRLATAPAQIPEKQQNVSDVERRKNKNDELDKRVLLLLRRHPIGFSQSEIMRRLHIGSVKLTQTLQRLRDRIEPCGSITNPRICLIRVPHLKTPPKKRT